MAQKQVAVTIVDNELHSHPCLTIHYIKLLSIACIGTNIMDLGAVKSRGGYNPVKYFILSPLHPDYECWNQGQYQKSERYGYLLSLI